MYSEQATLPLCVTLRFQSNDCFHPFCLQDGFVEFFQVADPESTVRNTLMAFAGVAGIGATLALLIR